MFPDEQACRRYMETLLWPKGFACAVCGTEGEPKRIATRPDVLRCSSCKAETTVTANTIMHRSKQDLMSWFWAAYLVTSETPGMSALQFQRQLGIKRYETAFNMLHKLRAGMVRPGRDAIGGQWPVEVDETFIGGRTRGQGRGRHHKVAVVGAVELRTLKKRETLPTPPEPSAPPRKFGLYAGRIRLRVVSDRTAGNLEPFVTENIAKGSHVITDGWSGYDKLARIGYSHEVNVADERAGIDTGAWLPMIHLIFSNLKTWLLGTHHGVSDKHLQAYLNEYVFRFNRRFWPMTTFHSVLGIGAGLCPPTYEGLYGGGYQHSDEAGSRCSLPCRRRCESGPTG